MKKTISPNSLKTLERLESNYRLLYVVIMGAPIIVALQNLAMTANKTTTIWESKSLDQLMWPNILLFLVFLGLYMRFFLGDLRFLDLKYLERQNSDDFRLRYNSFSRFIDFYSLVLHAMFFYILAGTVTSFHAFYIVFTSILVLNTIWLALTYLFIDTANRERTENKSTLRWIINNFIFAVILLLYYVNSSSLSANGAFTIFILFGLVNTATDYILTWNMYFPKILEETVQ